MKSTAGVLRILSTAGTAFLEALEGRELPGVAALSETGPRKRPTSPCDRLLTG